MINKINKFFNNIYIYLKNVIQYSPILWRDRDYDYIFILNMLKYKLERTRKHIVKHNIISDANEVGKEIALAETLIERIIADDYCSKEQAEHDLKWGERSDLREPSQTHPGYYIWKVNRKNIHSEQDRELERKEQHDIYDNMTSQKNADMDNLFSHLRNNILKWWC